MQPKLGEWVELGQKFVFFFFKFFGKLLDLFVCPGFFSETVACTGLKLSV